MRAPRLVPAVAATVLLAATMAWSGVASSGVAQAAGTTGSVGLTADTVGLSFAGETVAADGTVTDTWTNASGWQFVYTGPPGGQVHEAMTPAADSGTTLDLAASAPAGPIQSWCVKAIQGNGYRMTACNERTALYSAPNNHFIADDMRSQAHASSGEQLRATTGRATRSTRWIRSATWVPTAARCRSASPGTESASPPTR